jgi:2-C-methyl-D-erythritol 4-phosphate cytidylyltransferase
VTVAALVLLAGGSGQRAGLGINKAYAPLRGRPALAWSLTAAAKVPEIARMVLVVREEDRDAADEVIAGTPSRVRVDVVIGGATRHGSEWAALSHLDEPIVAGEIDVVAIHDGARPLAPPELFREVIEVAAQQGGAIPGRQLDAVIGGPSDGSLYAVQTPQAFRARPLLNAYRRADDDGFVGTDTAACLERYAPGVAIAVVPGPAANVKITFADDLALAERLAASG